MQHSSIAAFLAAGLATACAHADVIDFEDMAAGFTTAQPSTFVSGGVELFVGSFRDLGAGDVDVDFSGGSNTGFDLEANLRNARLGIDFVDNFGELGQTITLFYGGLVGEAAVFVSGIPSPLVPNLLALDGVVINSGLISVVPTGPGSGRLSIEGPMFSFAIGADNIWIDDIRSPSIPAPGVLGVAGIAGFAALRRRR